MTSFTRGAFGAIALSAVLVTSVNASVQPGRSETAVHARAETPASDLRAALGRLLGEHAYLVMESMRAAAADRADFDALAGGLDENTVALRDAIASIYGDPAGSAFQPIWQRHIDALFDWSRAKKKGDTAAADAALDALQRYRTEFGTFLTDANPAVSGDAEAHALQLHLDQLTSFVDMDFAQAFATERAAYSHMFDFGDDLARGIIKQFPDRFPDGKVAFSGRASLRLELGRLLGEHLVVAAEAMRAGLAERPDRAAAAASLAANSKDLAAAIGSIFGADAGTAFSEVWGNHLTTYLAYIEAVRVGDAASRAAALESLHMYHQSLAQFLNAAIPALSREDLEGLISHHVSALINQVDAAAAGDHVRTVAVTREAYAQMFKVGDALGSAIADQFPEQFVDVKDLPPTDTAGAGTRGDPMLLSRLIFLFGAALAAGMIALSSLRRHHARSDR